jgi:hypothetical protein
MNGMEPRTCGAIYMGPTGNEQGGHYFMSLACHWLPAFMQPMG